MTGQNINNGRISFVLNGESITLPVASVSVQKENQIKFNIDAKEEKGIFNRSISLNFICDDLAPESVTSDNFQIEINNEQKRNSENYQMSEKFLISFKNESESIFYNKTENEITTQLRPNTIKLKFNILEYSLSENQFIIKGEFSCTIKNIVNETEEIASLEQGKFEIII
jgi:hypothetical protein